MQWQSDQDCETSWAVLRRRLFMQNITVEPIATPDVIAQALRARGITPDDVEALWRLVGADGVRAAREALGE